MDIEELRSLVPSKTKGTTAVVSAVSVEGERAIAQVRGAMQIAKMFPRDEELAVAGIMSNCELLGVAENSFFSFPRGNTRVEGPSIDLLKLCARYWGNIDFCVEELERRDGESLAQAIAIDLETNARASRKFIVPHIRDKNDDSGQNAGKALTSARDIYEVIANMGSRRLRSCLEDLIPPHIVGAAYDKCQETLLNAAKKKPLEERVEHLKTEFAKVGVSEAMLVKFLGGRPLLKMLEAEYVRLRNIGTSIVKGAARVEDHFEKVNLADNMGNKGGKGPDPKDPQQDAKGAAATSDPAQASGAAAATGATKDTHEILLAELQKATTPEAIEAIGVRRKKIAGTLSADQKRALNAAGAKRAQELAGAAAAAIASAAADKEAIDERNAEQAEGDESAPE